MSSLYQTTGIVLSWRDYREADRWYSILTREHGKIECLARGASKPLAKLSPHLEMAAEADFLLVNGRVYHTIAGVERLRSFPNIYNDLSRLILAKNGLHLIDIGTKPEEQDSILYQQTLEWLSFLDSPLTKGGQRGVCESELSQERSGFLLASFALKLLAISGYRPELNRCLACKDMIAPQDYRWHALKGGVVCGACVERDLETWFAARPMDDETLKLIRFALQESFENQLRPSLPGQVLVNFHEAIESLIICHFPTIPANSLRGACQL